MIKRLDKNREAEGDKKPAVTDEDDVTPVAPNTVAATATQTTSPPKPATNISAPAATTAPVAPAIASAVATPTVQMTASSQYKSAEFASSSTQAGLDAIPNIDQGIIERKMLLEEAKFDLDREKTRHTIKMELMKERFRQEQLAKEEERNNSKEAESWMKAYWRPAMGWLYMAICAFDFIIAPILTMAMPIYLKMLGATTFNYTQWTSLTLANGGLAHLAFGAILGITAWTRGQEKLAKMG